MNNAAKNSSIKIGLMEKQQEAIDKYYAERKKCHVCESEIDVGEPHLLMIQPKIKLVVPHGGTLLITAVCMTCHKAIFKTLRKLMVGSGERGEVNE